MRCVLPQACYNCLAVLGPDASSPAVRVGRSLNFCSEACLADADRNYLEVEPRHSHRSYSTSGNAGLETKQAERAEQVEVDSDFSGLEEHCAATSQRFPLLIKRLACSMLASSRAHQEPFDSAVRFLTSKAGDISELSAEPESAERLCLYGSLSLRHACRFAPCRHWAS